MRWNDLTEEQKYMVWSALYNLPTDYKTHSYPWFCDTMDGMAVPVVFEKSVFDER